MEPLRPDWGTPKPGRFSPETPGFDSVMELHGQAVRAGRDCYADPATGFLVLTAVRLADRGRCCGSGCRHCPYL